MSAAVDKPSGQSWDWEGRRGVAFVCSCCSAQHKKSMTILSSSERERKRSVTLLDSGRRQQKSGQLPPSLLFPSYCRSCSTPFPSTNGAVTPYLPSRETRRNKRRVADVRLLFFLSALTPLTPLPSRIHRLLFQSVTCL